MPGRKSGLVHVIMWDEHDSEIIHLPPARWEEARDSYCADTIDSGKGRATFQHDGKLYVMTGGCFGPDPLREYLKLAQILPVERWDGETSTYFENARRIDDQEMPRRNLYLHVALTIRRKVYAIVQPCAIIAKRDLNHKEPDQLNLFD